MVEATLPEEPPAPAEAEPATLEEPPAPPAMPLALAVQTEAAAVGLTGAVDQVLGLARDDTQGDSLVVTPPPTEPGLLSLAAHAIVGAAAHSAVPIAMGTGNGPVAGATGPAAVAKAAGPAAVAKAAGPAPVAMAAGPTAGGLPLVPLGNRRVMPRSGTKMYNQIYNKYARAMVHPSLPEDFANKLATQTMSSSSLFHLWWKAGGDQCDKTQPWACCELMETIQSLSEQSVKTTHAFLTEKELAELPRFRGEPELMKSHMADCKKMGLWRRSPENPKESKLDEYYTRTETKAVETDRRRQSTDVAVRANLSKASAQALCTPQGPLGALPTVTGLHAKAQSAAWSTQFHDRQKSILDDDPPGKKEKKEKQDAFAVPQKWVDDASGELDPKSVNTTVEKYLATLGKEIGKQKIVLNDIGASGLSAPVTERLGLAIDDMEREHVEMQTALLGGERKPDFFKPHMKSTMDIGKVVKSWAKAASGILKGVPKAKAAGA